MKMDIRFVKTVAPVMLDSVRTTDWWAQEDGVKEIYGNDVGVNITWNFGSTFVPWANIVYVREL